MNTETLTFRRELARRVNGGLEITLYWDAIADRLTLDVYHLATEETITFPVASDRALDAFRHPFAYLAREGAPLPRTRGPQLLN